MASCLDPIWERYETAQDALKVVRRCVIVPGINRDRAFRNTGLYGLSDADCLTRRERSKQEIDDAAVLSLYARFEARLREHVGRQAPFLELARAPDPAFGIELAKFFEQQCESFRMDAVTNLFLASVGQNLVNSVGSIRTYRHWIAHGRTRIAPPVITPRFTYATLSGFLSVAQLA